MLEKVIPNFSWPILLRFSVITLLLTNIFPIFGIFYLGWDAGQMMLFYWWETAVVGVYNCFKIRKVWFEQDPAKYYPKASKNLTPVKKVLGFVALSTFQVIHMSGFMTGHLAFIRFFTSFDKGTFLTNDLPLMNQFIFFGVLGMFISHGVSYFINFIGKKEYENIHPTNLLAAPYKRIIVMHCAIIFGGFFMFFVGGKGPAIILVVIKTLVDLRSHLKEHQTLIPRLTA